MNVPVDIAKHVVDGLRSTPVVLGLILVNVVMLAGFWLTLNSVADAAARRDAMIKTCIERER